ncbi:MAG: FKBP-type peptidyl-prolyl cis-trans isomerase [Candidatus Acidifodinimicrobium sp.]
MISENDLVLINFVGKVKSTGQIIDFTYKELAEKENVDTSKVDLSPVLVIPSANYTFDAISKSLIGKKEGDKYSLDLKPEEAFGKFNSKLVKTYSLDSFRENKINPSVGDMVSLDGMPATVMSVGGGRVMVNFNHPLAGKELTYDIEVFKVLADDSEKISAIFKHYIGKPPEKVEIKDSDVEIKYNSSIEKHVVDAIIDDINKYVRKEFKVKITSS